ncbi:hypothetical protein ACA910_010388 [Epithemia clementina (nom. ined.)]
MKWRKNQYQSSRAVAESHPASANHNNNNDEDFFGSEKISLNEFNDEDEVESKNNDHHALIAKRETKQIFRLRVLVFSVLFLSMVLVSVVTYYYTSTNEQTGFEEAFKDNAGKVLQSLGASLDKALAGVDAFVVSMLSYARETNQTWPYVTIPDFEARSTKFLALTKAVVFMEFPLVTPETRLRWEQYTKEHGRDWANKSVNYLKENNLFQDVYQQRNITEPEYLDFVHDYSAWGVDNPQGLPYSNPGPFLPMWQSAPLIPTTPVYNWDLVTVVDNESVLKCLQVHKVSLSKAYHIAYPGDTSLDAENEAWADYFSSYITTGENPMEPLSDFYYPILEEAVDKRNVRNDPNYDPSQHKVLGIMSQSAYWRDMIKHILPHGTNGILVVFESPCNPVFTYEINGQSVKYLGVGDFHDSKYDYLERSSTLQNLSDFYVGETLYSYVPLEQDTCPWTVRVFPSAKFEEEYKSANPITFTIVAALIFIFTTTVLVFYDRWVERRQHIVMESAVRSDAIVSSLFPSTVRERLYNEEQKERNNTNRQKAFLSHQDGNKMPDIEDVKSPPIADLFPEATVLFADLAGFTSWSSTRDPVQVFTLLETLYGAFDKAAKRSGVFKVETIGDCYVAVCGVPEPRRNHAVVMARFAAECRACMNTLTKELELTMGPDTGELLLRCGMHSGAVTAGVLRGEKSRFQLFGDTVNTAARMESTGVPNRLQVSQKTADLLRDAGKGEWLTARSDIVEAKGKGKLQTYWVEPGTGYARSHSRTTDTDQSAEHTEGTEGENPLNNELDGDGVANGTPAIVNVANATTPTAVASAESVKTERLVTWNTKLLEGIIRKLVAHRQAISNETLAADEHVEENEQDQQDTASVAGLSEINALPPTSTKGKIRDEVANTISLPAFHKMTGVVDRETVELPTEISDQLRIFVASIAALYRDNPFHNFEHASHVTMSANKLLHRIVNMNHTQLSQHEMYIHSFGVAMDPLAQLAIVFSALIHDVDHRGVPNFCLVKEEPTMAERYCNKSIAEQNSVEIAWNLFMEPAYAELRSCLFPSKQEMKRFRQLVVNAVIATDIFDPELIAMRNKRWESAFSQLAERDDPDFLNRKATIVLEHVIQASDVCHTMQHWSIYQKWNRCLFIEMYSAYLSGRAGDKDPSAGWFEGELRFFDNYVIPLAKKLKECQVFGASSHELLDCAYDNRMEWENRGREIVEALKESMVHAKIQV